MPRARVHDIELYYERGGRASGPPVLLISGTGGDLRQEPSILESPLAATFDLLAYDQRGLGRSDKPDVAYSMADYGRDAAGLLDAVGWERCAVLGISFGGMVAQELALLAPDADPAGAVLHVERRTGRVVVPLHELEGLPRRNGWRAAWA